MIFVIDPDLYMLGDSSYVGKLWWGEWYYYYGNGVFVKVDEKSGGPRRGKFSLYSYS